MVNCVSKDSKEEGPGRRVHTRVACDGSDQVRGLRSQVRCSLHVIRYSVQDAWLHLHSRLAIVLVREPTSPGPLTHKNPCTISVQVIPQTVPDQRHSLNLVHVGVVEEIRDAKALKG